MATASSIYQFPLIDLAQALPDPEPGTRNPEPRPSHPEPRTDLQLVAPPPEINLSEEVRRLRAGLGAAIAARISSGTELIRALEKERRNEPVPTTIAGLDTLLDGGITRGRMTEIAGKRSSGRFAMAMAALSSITTMGEAAALIDLGDHFDPQIAASIGVDLRRLLWVRPSSMKQAVMSAEMLMVTGFSLVVIDAGIHPIRGKRAPDAAWVRLARAAESHGAALVVSTPYPLTGTASEAVILSGTTRLTWNGRGRSPRLLTAIDTVTRLEKHRRLRPGRSATVMLRMPGSVTNRESVVRCPLSVVRATSFPTTVLQNRQDVQSGQRTTDNGQRAMPRGSSVPRTT